MKRTLAVALALFAASSCSDDEPTSPEGDLLQGTWGGENVALVVEDTASHIHIGCTFGEFSAPIHVGSDGRFSVPGSYILRAYPVAIGPTLPAQFAGVVDGRRLTLTVAVNDTTAKELVVLGPVTATLGQDPRMGPCPICDRRMRPR